MSDLGLSRPAPSFLPATAVLEMTYQCNHACQFCSCPWYAPDGDFEIKPELEAGQWKALIRRLTGRGVCNFAFTGGEPLLKDNLEAIILCAAECEVEHIETENGRLESRMAPPNLYLLSNGLIMRDEILELCRTHRINLSMSLPGLSTFAEHTGGADPQHVLKWFGQAAEADVTTTVGITVTRKNIHELYETISEALLAGADTLLMNRFLPGGRGLEYADDLMLEQKHFSEMLDTAEEVLRAANRKGSVGTELPKCLVDQSRYTHLKVGTRCSAALDFFVVGPSGHIRVCNHSPVRLNHVDELEKVKTHAYWKRFIMKDYLPSQCNDCESLVACDGGCREAAHITGGSPDAMDPALT